MLTQRNSVALLYAAPVLFAVLAGLAVAAAPWAASVLAIVLIGGALFLIAARNKLRPAGQPTADDSDAAATDDVQLVLPRRLYYLGAATIGFLTVRPAVAFTLSDWIFFASFGLTCVALLTSRADRDFLIPRVMTTGVILFSVGGLVSSVHALEPLQSASVVLRLLYLTIVWFWLGTIVLQKQRHVENALFAWVASSAASAGGAIVQFFFGNVIPGGDVAWGRMTGFTSDYNSLGGLVAIAFVPALMIAVDARRARVRTFGMVCVALLVAGLLLSGSVGSMLAVFVATIFWLAVRGITRRTVMTLGVIAVAGAILITATGSTNSPNPLNRLTRVTSKQEAVAGTGGSLYTRLHGYRLAWDRIEADPFVGVGLDDASSFALFGDKLVHNMLLSTWTTAGIVGLVGILLMVGGAVSVGATAVRRAPPHLRSLNASLLASVVAFIAFGMSEPILFVRYGWFPAALLVALHAQTVRAESPHRQPVVARRGAIGRLRTV